MRILCTAKDSHIFSTKNNSVFVTLADICITNLCLNDALNNWVLFGYSLQNNLKQNKDLVKFEKFKIQKKITGMFELMDVGKFLIFLFLLKT